MTGSRYGRSSYQTFQSQGHGPLPVGHPSSGDEPCGEFPQPIYETTGWPAAIRGNMSIKLKD
ncbi:mucin [Aspergillus luchuensis]|uniref:Mucin n=1 Tax=Aspergillus kawachii TaxID=1069201 RepID=A0A146FL67_ASPKA|nr:mucin [Aspergillus luchuensis]